MVFVCFGFVLCFFLLNCSFLVDLRHMYVKKKPRRPKYKVRFKWQGMLRKNPEWHKYLEEVKSWRDTPQKKKAVHRRGQEGQLPMAGNASEKGAGPQPWVQKGEAEIPEEEQVILFCHPPTLALLRFLQWSRCLSGDRDDETCIWGSL